MATSLAVPTSDYGAEPMPSSSATWITRLDEGSGGVRVAVKDLIDVAGVPTTAGSRAVADHAAPAECDAPCLLGLRSAVDRGDAVLVGKANLHELADGISGINPWFGTPANPLDAARVPGGSSSGCATAVGQGEADVAVGTDTGGSVRIPAACCGVAGLKTTHGRVSLRGVWPLAPSLDTVGPLARDVAGLAAGMALLEPSFGVGPVPDGPIGRLRALGSDGQVLRARPDIEAAVDTALAATGLEVIDITMAGWLDAARAALHIIGAEAAALHRAMALAHPDDIGADVQAGLAEGARVGRQQLLAARSLATKWQSRWDRGVFGQVSTLALPVLDGIPPRLDEDVRAGLTVRWTAPINLAGLPSLALPVPRQGRGPIPTSIQLVGPVGSEEGLLGLGRLLELALA
jgi:amidase